MGWGKDWGWEVMACLRGSTELVDKGRDINSNKWLLSMGNRWLLLRCVHHTIHQEILKWEWNWTNSSTSYYYTTCIVASLRKDWEEHVTLRDGITHLTHPHVVRCSLLYIQCTISLYSSQTLQKSVLSLAATDCKVAEPWTCPYIATDY